MRDAVDAIGIRGSPELWPALWEAVGGQRRSGRLAIAKGKDWSMQVRMLRVQGVECCRDLRVPWRIVVVLISRACLLLHVHVGECFWRCMPTASHPPSQILNLEPYTLIPGPVQAAAHLHVGKGRRARQVIPGSVPYRIANVRNEHNPNFHPHLTPRRVDEQNAKYTHKQIRDICRAVRLHAFSQARLPEAFGSISATSKPQTPNPKPLTLNPRPQSLHHKPLNPRP